MKRIILILALGFVFQMDSGRAETQQQPKVPRIGYVTGSGGANNPGPNIEAFQQGLRDLGYIERKNILNRKNEKGKMKKG